MIVTFHIAVYFVYYVWNNYISPLITDDQSTQNNVGGSRSGNTNQANLLNEGGSSNEAQNTPGRPTGDLNDASGRTNLPKPSHKPKNQSGNTDHSIQNGKSTQSQEGEGDHPCLPDIFSEDEDKGRDMIYNVEPEYTCICTNNKVQFIPPVYVQRYMEIERILKQPYWANTVKKVVDFGCAELSFEMRYLKPLHGIEEIVAVDIDTLTLESNCCKVSPFPTDYLKKRPTPLRIRVFQGSVAHTHDSLTDADAVIAIELIEHLFPPELDCLPFTVFGFIKPKIAIFTTPNSDFNVIFTGLVGFRHPDHKFEWSQQQFEDWAHNVVERYPDYQVTFKGIGPGYPGTEKYGCCSQMATFIRVNESNVIADDEIHVQDGAYTLIAENVFPFFIDERTEEEKIGDAAEFFINTCKMRRRIRDDDKSEIPIQSVMGRIKYYDKEKLKEILKSRNWEVKMNSSCEEVVLFPDSEEEEDSETESNELLIDNYENQNYENRENEPESDENWDCVEGEDMDITFTGTCNVQECPRDESSGDHACATVESYHFVNTVNTTPTFCNVADIGNMSSDVNTVNTPPTFCNGADIGNMSSDVNTVNTTPTFCNGADIGNMSSDVNTVNTTPTFCNGADIGNTSSDKLKCSSSEKCSIPETTVPDIELSHKLSCSSIDAVPEKDTNLNFEKSIYETPYNNYFGSHLKSNCDLCECCRLPSADETVKGCKRALVMESPKELAQLEETTESEDPVCCLSTMSSSCDTSIYATPCCPQRHRNNIPKCLSLQQISTFSGSPAFGTELDMSLTEGKLIKDEDARFSKSMEGFKSLENDLTCSSTSRVIDSGYPDSSSEYIMDMDLTPEQFDDIETENDASSRSLSPPLPPPQIPWLVDDVQNGDVVNNNRDGEGNNLVADMEEEQLEFEARIDEINNEVLNQAPANDAVDSDHEMKLGEPFHEVCGDCLPCFYNPPSSLDSTHDEHAPKKSHNHDLTKPKSVFTEKNTEIFSSESLDRQSLRSTKSDTSIATNYSFSLDPSEGETVCKTEGLNSPRKVLSPKFKTHNSLTTVLDGYSKFSNCSLVRPVEVYQVTGLFNDSPNDKAMPSGSREPVQQEDSSDALATASVPWTGSQDDRPSLLSVYQSAESLNNPSELQTEQETSSFPAWLLNILVSDVFENEIESVDSVESVWDSDSLEDRMELNYDVQVDARGGGDPLRDTWH